MYHGGLELSRESAARDCSGLKLARATLATGVPLVPPFHTLTSFDSPFFVSVKWTLVPNIAIPNVSDRKRHEEQRT